MAFQREIEYTIVMDEWDIHDIFCTRTRNFAPIY